MISIIIPLYNKKNYIEQTLQSVLEQTYSDLEIVVVDDGSSDGSPDVVERIEDDRIRLIRQANTGVSAARNTGMIEAKGNWIAFLDADDTWHSQKLEKQMHWLEKYPEVMWASCGFSRTPVPGRIQRVEKFKKNWFAQPCLLKDALIPLSCGRHFWTGTVMINKKVLDTIDLFDTSLRTGEDIDFFFRLVCHYPQAVYVPECLAYYLTGIESALTSNMNAFTDSTHMVKFSQRIASYGDILPENRNYLSRLYAGNLLRVLLTNLLGHKKSSLARQVLAEAEKSHIKIRNRTLKLKVYFPWLEYFDLKAKAKEYFKAIKLC